MQGTGRFGYQAFSDAISITKRYFTSTFHQPFIGFINILNANHFDVRRDAVLAAEIEHLLGLGEAADGRAGEAASSEYQAETRDGERLLRGADEGEVAVAAEQVDIGVDVVVGGDGVEDEVEAPGMLLHLIGVAGDDDLVGAEAERVLLLAGRGGEDNDVGAECMGELAAHVPNPPIPTTPTSAFGDPPVAHGLVRRDPGAKQRCDPGKIEVGGDAQNKAFIDDNTVRVAAVGDAPEVFVRGAVGEDLVWAELLKASPAMGAGAVRIDQAADAGQIARLELGDRGTDLGDPADDLAARHAGVTVGMMLCHSSRT